MAKRQKYTLDDGREMIFSTERFREELYKYQLRMRKDGVKLSRENLLEKLAEECHTSSGAMVHWVKGHNGPSDLEKVENLANALGIATEDLLEKENESSEENNMENIITENKIDYSSTKSIVNGIYDGMVEYIEMYRMAREMNFDMKPEAFKLWLCARKMTLMKVKFHLPKKLFEDIYSFEMNYIQQIACYLKYKDVLMNDVNFPIMYPDSAEEWWELYRDGFWDGYGNWDYTYADIDFDSEDSKLFKKAIMKEFDSELNVDGYEMNNEFFISQAAYKRLDEILKDYIPD